jgi:hypothetical protein
METSEPIAHPLGTWIWTAELPGDSHISLKTWSTETDLFIAIGRLWEVEIHRLTLKVSRPRFDVPDNVLPTGIWNIVCDFCDPEVAVQEHERRNFYEYARDICAVTRNHVYMFQDQGNKNITFAADFKTGKRTLVHCGYGPWRAVDTGCNATPILLFSTEAVCRRVRLIDRDHKSQPAIFTGSESDWNQIAGLSQNVGFRITPGSSGSSAVVSVDASKKGNMGWYELNRFGLSCFARNGELPGCPVQGLRYHIRPTSRSSVGLCVEYNPV